MGKITGFLEIHRVKPKTRPVPERIRDWREVYLPVVEQDSRNQGARCMDCSIPFCHQGCPLGNLVPDWNDLVYRNRWRAAIERLHATNNFPEWTGRLCPAPCEASCVLSINDDPVTIKSIELSIIERAFDEGWIRPEPPAHRTGKHAAVIGSGPAGLAAAQQLNRAGHFVTVFERSDRIGGLLRYGIPEFKMEKRVLDRRLSIMEAEGIVFRTNASVGSTIPARDLTREYDDVGFCCHKVVMSPQDPSRLFQQNHVGTHRSDDGGKTWTEITEGLPTDFGFACAVHPQDRDTLQQYLARDRK